MGNKRLDNLKERVELAAEAALKTSGSVGPLELLVEMRLLAPSHFTSWRKGIIPALEDVIQGSPEKLQRSFEHFRQWARNRGMKPVKIPYHQNSPGGTVSLHVTLSGDPALEDFYRTRYIPDVLSTVKTEQTVAKIGKPQDIVVFETVSRSVICTECRNELTKGDFLFMEKGQPLCLSCADLDYLDYLPSGNAALTRRARKYSRLSAVVVRFARARKRYERQGILVEPDAIAKAEQECLDDEDQRMARREREATRRAAQDEKLVAEMAQSIRRIYPGCSAEESEKIACHTALRGSGRVGRSAAGRNLEEQAIELAVTAWIRHQWTEYDELLYRGYERLDARDLIRHKVQEIISRWKDK